MRTLIAVTTLITSACNNDGPFNNSSESPSNRENLSVGNEMRGQIAAEIEGLRFICFSFDGRRMSELTINRMIRSIDEVRDAYQSRGIRLAHQFLTNPGQVALIDNCRPATSAGTSADEILLVSISPEGNGTRLAFRRGGRPPENSLDQQEPRVWIEKYLYDNIGQQSPSAGF